MLFTIKNIARFFIAFYLLFSIGTHFDIIYGSRISYIVLFAAIWGFLQLNLRINNSKTFIMFYTLILTILFSLPNFEGVIVLPKYTILIPIMFLLQLDDLISIYKILIILFIVSVIPSLIVLIFYIFGIESLLNPKLYLESYRPFIIYPGTLVQPSAIIRFAGFKFIRISGILGEPGGLATIALFILIAENLNLKPWYNKFILFIGIISFSLAFYILFSLFLIFKTITIKRFREVIPVIVIVIVFYFGVKDTLVYQQLMGDRIAQTNLAEGQIGNYKRTFVSTSEFFDVFIHQDAYHLLFGRGEIYEAALYANYMALIYNWGLVTTVMQVLLLFIIFNPNKTGVIGVYIAILITISLYQRPAIFNTGTIFLFYFASLNFQCKKFNGIPIKNYFLKNNKKIEPEHV